METRFDPKSLEENSYLRQANDILRNCVHCGLCSATCSSYQILGDERDSPRGRIYLMKHMLEAEQGVPSDIVPHLDRCLSCYACMTTCPSGVNYRHLIDFAREKIETEHRRSWSDRLRRRTLRAILPFPKRFRIAMGVGRLFKWVRKPLSFMGLKQEAALLSQIPPIDWSFYHRFKKVIQQRKTKAEETQEPLKSVGRVVIFKGCAQSVLRPQINEALARICERLGLDIVPAEQEGCCGAIDLHLGANDQGAHLARANVNQWWSLNEQAPLDAIVVTATGCGSTITDYRHLLQDDDVSLKKLEKIAPLVFDVSQFLAAQTLGAPRQWTDLRVAYQFACSMQHSLKIGQEPFDLLTQAGFSAVPLENSQLCCGSAGTYSILQPDISKQLREKKVAAIENAKPDIMASGNIGCLTHLQPHLQVPAVHMVELIDWAYGGPTPKELRHLEHRAKPFDAQTSV